MATGGVGGSCKFEVEVLPGPAIRCTDQQVTVERGAGDPLRVEYDPATVEGGCYPTAVACSPPPGSVFEPGTTEVSCLARDTQGNEATCSLFLTVTSILVGAPLAGVAGLGALGVALIGFGVRALRRRPA
jgi:hypothetical protein